MPLQFTHHLETSFENHYVSILPFFLLRGSRNICMIFVFIRRFRCKGSPITLHFFSNFVSRANVMSKQPLGPLLLKSHRVWGWFMYSKNFSRAPFFVFWGTHLVDRLEKSAVCHCNAHKSMRILERVQTFLPLLAIEFFFIFPPTKRKSQKISKFKWGKKMVVLILGYALT